jgi:radical SAM superfamily enzyme YgiQ (UPF0313 family)
MTNPIEKAYQDRSLYRHDDIFTPPAERRQHAIAFELTTGCDWGQCTYCSGYEGVPFNEKSLDDYKEHVDAVFENLKGNGHNLGELKRAFIGGGNGLAVETDKLCQAVRYTRERFEEYTGSQPRRVAIYGRTPAIQKKGKDGMRDLQWHGLSMLYWGLESGSNNVLNYTRRGYTQDDVIDAANSIRFSPLFALKTSVMVMPGLGGKRFEEEHATETAKVLGMVRPDYITFIGINPSPNSEYARRMEQEMYEGTNRPLTDREMAAQLRNIIDEMPSFPTKAGCYFSSSFLDRIGHNPLTFTSYEISSPESKRHLATGLGISALFIKE